MMNRRDPKEIEVLARVIADASGVDVSEFMRDDQQGQYLDLGDRGLRLALIQAREAAITERGQPAEEESQP